MDGKKERRIEKREKIGKGRKKINGAFISISCDIYSKVGTRTYKTGYLSHGNDKCSPEFTMCSNL